MTRKVRGISNVATLLCENVSNIFTDMHDMTAGGLQTAASLLASARNVLRSVYIKSGCDSNCYQYKPMNITHRSAYAGEGTLGVGWIGNCKRTFADPRALRYIRK